MPVATTLQSSHLARYWQGGMFLALLTLLCGAAGTWQMPYWLAAATIMLSGLVLTWQLTRPQQRLLEVTCLSYDVWHWRMGFRHQQGVVAEAFEGRLAQVRAYGWAVTLSLQPREGRLQHWTVFRDQVTPMVWRELVVLARYWG